MKDEIEKRIEGLLNDEGLRQLGNDKFYSLVERLTDLATDLKIMPDGRPLFAWENELEGLRKENVNLEPKRKEIISKMHLLRIAEMEAEKESWSGDIVVRFRMMDNIHSSSPLPEKYTVEKKGTSK